MQTDEFRQMDTDSTNSDTPSIKNVSQELIDEFLTVFKVDKFYKPLLDLKYQDLHDFRYCDICYTQRENQEYSSIWECSHETCVYCIAQFLDFKMQVHHTDDFRFKCLVCNQGDMVIEKLQQYIRYAPVKDLTAENTYSFFSKRLCMGDKPIYYCISPVCRWILDPIQGENFYKCGQCTTTFCKDCRLEGHYERSCEEYKVYKERIDLEDPDFLEYMKENKLQICPNCSMRVERIDGCPHMTCYSPICQGSYEFCYYCGTNLTGWPDYSVHFTPDGTTCFTYIERNPIEVPVIPDPTVDIEVQIQAEEQNAEEIAPEVLAVDEEEDVIGMGLFGDSSDEEIIAAPQALANPIEPAVIQPAAISEDYEDEYDFELGDMFRFAEAQSNFSYLDQDTLAPVEHFTYIQTQKPLISIKEADELTQRYCDICYSQKDQKEFDSIWQCGMEACVKCVRVYLNYKISINLTEDYHFKCPMCNEGELLLSQLNRYIRTTQGIDSIFEERTMKFLQKRFSMGDKPIYYCISPVCRWILDPIQGENFYKCAQCTTTFCKACGLEGHYERSCDEQKVYKERIDLEDPDFLEYMKANKLQICPKCSMRVERIDGCPHMTCRSPICKGTCEFCYYCGTNLTGWPDDSVHFTPDGLTCFTYRERNPIEPPAQEQEVLVEEIEQIRAQEEQHPLAMQLEVLAAEEMARLHAMEQMARDVAIESILTPPEQVFCED